jgi:hypothetical protein
MVIELKKKKAKKKICIFFLKKNEVSACRTPRPCHKIKKNKKEKHMDYMLFSM